MMTFRPGQRLVIPGVQVLSPRPSSAAVTGILDGISNVAAAYSLRKLRSAYVGSAVRVRRSSDSTEQDIGFASDGEFDSSAFSSFVGGGTGYVRTWYDQSGNSRDATQTTTGSQPSIELSTVNGMPVVRFANQYLLATFAVTGTDASVIYAAQRVSKTLQTSDLTVGASGQHDYDSTSRIIWAYQGSDTDPGEMTLYYAGFTARKTHPGNGNTFICSGIKSSSTIAIRLNGGTATSTAASGSLDASLVAIAARLYASGPGAVGNVRIGEIIMLSTAISTTDHNTIGTNMATRYGLSWTTVT